MIPEAVSETPSRRVNGRSSSNGCNCSEELRTRVFGLGRDREFADSPLEEGVRERTRLWEIPCLAPESKDPCSELFATATFWLDKA